MIIKSKERYVYEAKGKVLMAIALLILIAPVIIYNAVNYEIFTQKNSALGLTIAGLMTMIVIGIAVFTELNPRAKSALTLPIVGAFLIMLSTFAEQVGWSLVIVFASDVIYNAIRWIARRRYGYTRQELLRLEDK